MSISRNKISLKYFAIKIVFVASVLGFLSSMAASSSYAIAINKDIANVGYWYVDEDIRGILGNRLGDSAYIAPAAHNVPELINEVAVAAVNGAKTGKAALIPVNLNNSHWTALAIRMKADGGLVVFFNDSMGGSIGGGSSESGQYIAAIKGIVPDAEIIDLMVHQQNDGSSCGAFTAENLIVLGTLDQANLTAEEAKNALASITDAAAIRLKQLSEYPELAQSLIQSIDNVQQKANAYNTQEQIIAVSNIALNEISNISTITSDRLSHLYLGDSLSGYSSGDDEPSNYGVWAGGNFIYGNYKSNNSGKLKQKSVGATIGFDGKLDEDTIIGVAVSNNRSRIKPNGINPNVSVSPKTTISNQSITDINSVIFGLYGSFRIDENLVLTGNMNGGKTFAKTKYQSIFTRTTSTNIVKLKGNVFAANITANYYIPVESIIFIPSIGAGYESTKFAAIDQPNFSINKTNIRKFNVTPAFGVTKIFEFGNISVVPELNASFDYSPKLKSNKSIIKNNNGMVLGSSAIPISKTSLNLGGNITLASDVLELSLGYERVIQNRYQGQVLQVKLRVNL